MQRFSTARLFVVTILLAFLSGPMPASAQPAPPPVRPTLARPAIAPARPVLAPTQQGVASPSPRGAACHGGKSFDQFLAGLKQEATAAGVSQRALAEAAPYLVYDQGIVNRDRGQRVFGQVFTVFAGRMAAISRMQQG